jgi:hypothetical protein
MVQRAWLQKFPYVSGAEKALERLFPRTSEKRRSRWEKLLDLLAYVRLTPPLIMWSLAQTDTDTSQLNEDRAPPSLKSVFLLPHSWEFNNEGRSSP